MRTIDKLNRRDSHLCIGLDPDPKHIPLKYSRYPDPIRAFLQDVVLSTCDVAAAYKINTAFFEALGPTGWQTLYDIVQDIKIHKDIPVIIDAKRCDVGHTARAYARAIYEELGADATTVLPFFGEDGIAPFLAYPDKLTFVVVASSNPSGQTIQTTLQPHLKMLLRREPVGLVCPGTYPDIVLTWRHKFPDNWILIPGCGTQGGNLEQSVLAAKGRNFLITVSRAILYSEDMELEARTWRDDIHRILGS